MMKLAGLFVVTLLFMGQRSQQDDSLAYQQLKPLEAFVGTWEGTATLPSDVPDSEQLGKIAGRKVKVVTTNRWAKGKSALIEEFSYEIDGAATIEGVSIRAWDQAAEQICSHSFTTHRGTWEETWRLEGDTWVQEFKGMNLDRKEIVGKREIVFQDNDHYTLSESSTANGTPRPIVKWKFRRLK